MLRGVQGLVPARGRRRNACAGKRQAKGSLKTIFSIFRLPIMPHQAQQKIQQEAI